MNSLKVRPYPCKQIRKLRKFLLHGTRLQHTCGCDGNAAIQLELFVLWMDRGPFTIQNRYFWKVCCLSFKGNVQNKNARLIFYLKCTSGCRLNWFLWYTADFLVTSGNQVSLKYVLLFPYHFAVRILIVAYLNNGDDFTSGYRVRISDEQHPCVSPCQSNANCQSVYHPSGKVQRRWEDSNPRPLCPNTTALSSWPPPTWSKCVTQ